MKGRPLREGVDRNAYVFVYVLPLAVALYARAWIEILLVFWASRVMMSPSTRGRG